MTTLQYHPRLDGIRAFAVFGVLQEHFKHSRFFNFGGLGVEAFFVLSGYLISRIIFDYKKRNVPLRSAALQFYWRRILRLIPPLYVAIAITALFGVANMRQDWLWHASYLTNLKVYLEGHWGPATHFWSLSVEEQFYLIWFFVLILTPLRYCLALIVTSIVLGALYICSMYFPGQQFNFVLLPGALAYLALGALIAYGECLDQDIDSAIRNQLSSPTVLLISFVIVLVSSAPFLTQNLRDVTGNFATGVFAFCLVAAARSGAQGRYLRVLDYPLIRHVGRISYGIYVYHLFVPQFFIRMGLTNILLRATGGGKFFGMIMLTLSVSITLIVSELSWRLMEKPLARFKSMVPFLSEPPQPAIAPAKYS